VCANLASNEYLIPCADEEIQWLAGNVRCNERVLMPLDRCLRMLRKPARAVAGLLEVRSPASLLVPARQERLDAFLEKYGSRVWHKGRIAGAELSSLEAIRSSGDFASDGPLSRRKDLLLQAHVDGSLEVLSFAAYKGRFLMGVWMRKLGVTSKGKTWSGAIMELSAEWRSRLQTLVHQLSWHGGGAFEFVRNSHAQLWLIDANPRFPAWIHGATLCGFNLPAALLSAASGTRGLKAPDSCKKFSRVVVEVAVRSQFASSLEHHVVE
jgi:diaminopimelate decarboxylase